VARVLLTFSLSLFLVFIASGGPGDSRAADDLVLGYTNLNGAKVPVPLGVDERIFVNHGIDLKIVPVSPGTQGVPISFWEIPNRLRAPSRSSGKDLP